MAERGVPRGLTLDEVRASGVTARAADERGEFRWMGGTVRTGEKVWWRPLADGGGREGVWTLRTDLEPPPGGWWHEPPCNCRHCRGAA
jgi:hypothetical protein